MNAVKVLVRNARSLSMLALGANLLLMPALYLARSPVVAAAPPPAANTFRVATFNTEYWHIPEQALVDTVRYQDMDIVFFQEHLKKRGNTWGPTNRIAQLRAVVPKRHVAVNGEVVTVSRWPIVHTRAFSGGEALRTDVAGPGGRIISAYNVHLPVHLHLELLSSPWRFYQDAQATAARREQLLREVTADLATNPHPVVVGGDFNASPAMHGTDWFRKNMVDAYAGRHCPQASDTFDMAGVLTWRIDYVYMSRHFKPGTYCTRPAPAISDHQAVMVGLMLAQTSSTVPDSSSTRSRP